MLNAEFSEAFVSSESAFSIQQSEFSEFPHATILNAFSYHFPAIAYRRGAPVPCGGGPLRAAACGVPGFISCAGTSLRASRGHLAWRDGDDAGSANEPIIS